MPAAGNGRRLREESGQTWYDTVDKVQRKSKNLAYKIERYPANHKIDNPKPDEKGNQGY